MNMKDIWLAFSEYATATKSAESEPINHPKPVASINRQLPVPVNER
ncbi:MAG: hypothetical protein LBK26_00910 [Rickettsiales bacterium]|jgi:hypothetical protein|nr:hypothetical protein [Rickettsiales bacterium]